MKMFLLSALISNLILPTGFGILESLGLILLSLFIISILIGVIESGIARLRMTHVFEFVFVMSTFALVVASLVAVKMYGV